jgi:hypothetical protein
MANHRWGILVNPKNFRDAELFAGAALQRVQRAAAQLAWLLDRGYPLAGSLGLVGDRWALEARQRSALHRAAATAATVAGRAARRVPASALAGRWLAIDAYNVLTTARVVAEGGLVIRGRDGAHRDLAGAHRRARDAAATWAAAQQVRAALAPLALAGVRWVIDAPVSGSGRLATALRAAGDAVVMANDADAALLAEQGVVLASADGRVIDGPQSWFDLAGLLAHTAWVVAPFETAPLEELE